MRYNYEDLIDFTSKKFVLLSGPRQVGKTTMAKAWVKSLAGEYLNWDILKDRQAILKQSYLKKPHPPAFVFDELHKYLRWKSYLKGLYDSEHSNLKVVVTGSAKLDVFLKGQDSLLGRYEYLRLHPYTIGEMTHGEFVDPPQDWLSLDKSIRQSNWDALKKFSGFPEPLFREDKAFHARWSTRRRSLLLTEDIRDLAQLRNLSLVEHLAILLPERVGSPLSINSLREILQVAHDTVNSWLELLERIYYCFRIPPFHKNLSRSITKERKLYLWDWTEIEDPGAKFENMVASHLLKAVHGWTDKGLGEFDLCYWRNAEKEEVDFIITEKRRPLVIIECKLGEENFSPSLTKLSRALKDIPAIQLVEEDITSKRSKNLLITNAARFLAGLL